jgi:manganese efflux pump family protein
VDLVKSHDQENRCIGAFGISPFRQLTRSLDPVLALLLVAASLGASNFAAAIGIGLAGVDARLRLRVAIAFGLFEGGMPLIGIAIGRHVATAVGSDANLIAGGLLTAIGLFTIATSRSRAAAPDNRATLRHQGMTRLLISGAALSVDNLIVGFALGTYNVSLPIAAAIIAAVSVIASLIGLEVGHRIGRRIEYDVGILAGGVLTAVSIAIGVGLI